MGYFNNFDLIYIRELNYKWYYVGHKTLQLFGNPIILDRNGNGSGSGRVFSYPDPTRGARRVARTRPV